MKMIKWTTGIQSQNHAKRLGKGSLTLTVKSVLEMEKKEPKSEKSTHPLNRLKYGISMERATHEPFCSVLSRQAGKSRVKLSNTPQPPLPWFTDISPQSSAKTKPAIFHRACYFTVSGEKGRFIQHVRRKKNGCHSVQQTSFEIWLQITSVVHNRGITFKWRAKGHNRKLIFGHNSFGISC